MHRNKAKDVFSSWLPQKSHFELQECMQSGEETTLLASARTWQQLHPKDTRSATGVVGAFQDSEQQKTTVHGNSRLSQRQDGLCIRTEVSFSLNRPLSVANRVALAKCVNRVIADGYKVLHCLDRKCRYFYSLRRTKDLDASCNDCRTQDDLKHWINAVGEKVAQEAVEERS